MFTFCCAIRKILRMSLSDPTAAILVIGDEILKGQTHDTNSHYAAKVLYSLGIKLGRIVTVGDDINEIAKEIRHLSKQYTFVITSGGIGPTHDDITYEGIATAFNLELELNDDLASILNVVYEGPKDISKNPAMKMAMVPKDHELVYINNINKQDITLSSIPVVKVKNIYIFPGIPEHFETSLASIKNSLPSAIGKRFTDEIYLTADEIHVVSALNATLVKFEEHKISIGCYPVLYNAKYSTKITVETSNIKVLIEVIDYLKRIIPNKLQVDMISSVPVTAIQQKVVSLPCQQHVEQALKVLCECFQKYKPEQIVISFNGGKDCTALLCLAYAALRSWHTKSPTRLQALYVRCPEPFSEVEDFVRCAVQRYQLDLLQYDENIKDAVVHMLRDKPQISAVLMGNRRSDPHAANLTPFQLTDPGWPQMMRVFPMLEWSYEDVWQVLLYLRIPYCPLYDQGYTSLGNRTNTAPNPALRYEDANGQTCYYPAYKLQDTTAERIGRNSATTSTSSTTNE